MPVILTPEGIAALSPVKDFHIVNFCEAPCEAVAYVALTDCALEGFVHSYPLLGLTGSTLAVGR